jgi:hypothetical protein
MRNIKPWGNFINESGNSVELVDQTTPFKIAADIMKILTPEEAKLLGDFYKQHGKEKVSQILSEVNEAEMSELEYDIRGLIDKIIKGMQFVGMLTPGAIVTNNWELMIGLGLASLAGEALKDAAWWKLGGGTHEKEKRASRNIRNYRDIKQYETDAQNT